MQYNSTCLLIYTLVDSALSLSLLIHIDQQFVWEPVALQLLNIFVPLLLQKPSARSKARDHIRVLTGRLEVWRNGNLNQLVAEGRTIQKMLQKSSVKKLSDIRAFSRLMLIGKVKQALKLVDENGTILGLNICNICLTTEDVKKSLRDKHPYAAPANPQALLSDECVENVQPVLYKNIDSGLISHSTMNIEHLWFWGTH